MSTLLAERKILLGVTGSISAYKVPDWLRNLRREGAEVRVVMTEAATRFVAPHTFIALSGQPVPTGMFDPVGAEEIPHISLARASDLILVAPATATTIARLASGLADDLLSAIVLATEAPVVVCPAMNSRMYTHPATQANLDRLRQFGYQVVTPACGRMACGEEGPGRLPDWETVRQTVLAAFAPQDLAGRPVLVTAGPTWEPLDPVRFLGNRSTGRMGYAIAAAARQRGAEVTLVSGPSSLADPPGVEVLRVTTAAEMYEAVLARQHRMAVVVKAAAVSDYRPAEQAAQKLKKGDAAVSLELVPNRDILLELGKHRRDEALPLLVGFAAESHDHLDEGWRKLKRKNLDLMVVNDITAADSGFAVETNRVTILDREGGTENLPLLTKEETAHRIWDRVAKLL